MNQGKKNGLGYYLRLAFAGFSMGVANVIPGVSGGTMAFILGIFNDLVAAIREFACADTVKKLLHFQFKELYNTLPWRFLLAVFIGLAVALVSAAKLFTWLLEKYQNPTYAFFFGLMVVSTLLMLKKIKRWGAAPIVSLIIGAVVAYMVITMVPVTTPNVWYVWFLCGMIVICATILPGISGSFLLLILGQYTNIWEPVGNLPGSLFTAQGAVIWWTGLGAVIGLGAFVHLLTWLFKNFENATVGVLIGFMAGSLPRLWPWQSVTEVMIKFPDKTTKLFTMPESTELVNVLVGEGAKVSPVKIAYELPEAINGYFFMIVGLIVFGGVVVYLTEKLASGKDENTLEEVAEDTK